jgi:hypothetical protein
MLQVGGPGLAGLLLAPRLVRGYTPAEVRQPATLSGTVRYAGRRRRPEKVVFSGDCAYCRRFDLRVESLLVSPKGGLRNAVVALEGVARGKPPAPAVPALAEHRCTFVPHVQSVNVGSRILLHNQDPVLNTFHAVALPSGRTLFNIGTPNKDQRVRRRIRETGVIQMRCDVHPWEEAYLVSFDHPYHAVTDAKGAFVLEQIPPGRYTLSLWHEKLGVRRRRVELAPGAHLKLELTYPAAKAG